MTLAWLDSQGIRYEATDNLSQFHIHGNQRYHAFTRRIPGDFSSAAFPLCAAALKGGAVTVEGLEMADTQGDKRIVEILHDMGARIETTTHSVTVTGAPLHGVTVDMNEIPDALPMLAVTACFASGTTILHNVAQARIKETDRIAVMAAELVKLGANVKELPDGLEIHGGGLNGGRVHGHGDHRIVMAMTVAGFAANSPITVDTAEAADITYPTFWDGMRALGGTVG
jgi:3-phosphoshikimate 1-carboxyvinyltransferase